MLNRNVSHADTGRALDPRLAMTDFYLAAADELRRGAPDAALWSKVLTRATDATEARSLYLAERSRSLGRVHAWESRPLFSRVVDAVLFVFGCTLAGSGMLGVGALLYEAWPDWTVLLQHEGGAWMLTFLILFAGAAVMGVALACAGARAFWFSR